MGVSELCFGSTYGEQWTCSTRVTLQKIEFCESLGSFIVKKQKLKWQIWCCKYPKLYTNLNPVSVTKNCDNQIAVNLRIFWTASKTLITTLMQGSSAMTISTLLGTKWLDVLNQKCGRKRLGVLLVSKLCMLLQFNAFLTFFLLKE